METTQQILSRFAQDRAQLIAILQEIQTQKNYLSQEDMTTVAEYLDISVSAVYSVATFYENFSLEPKGKHIIKVCDGTACHVRKSQPIFDALHDADRTCSLRSGLRTACSRWRPWRVWVHAALPPP